MLSRIGCIWMILLLCEFSNVFSNRLSEQMRSRIGCIWTIFSRVNFQMSFQIDCRNRCIVAMVAFQWLFSSVSFQMFSVIVWVNRCESRWLHLNDFSPEWVFKCLLEVRYFAFQRNNHYTQTIWVQREFLWQWYSTILYASVLIG